MKKILKFLVIIGILGGIVYYLYNMYQNIEIKDYYEAERLSVSTEKEQTVENLTEESKTMADIIEDATGSVCGISKLQSVGGSILSDSAADELGLGTGIVVSSNGYILSNSHVTGNKYSSCYVTIEDGDTYRGKVVWADSDLDLSITKIDVENLKYAKLGDSNKMRVGETVFAIGNPIGYEFRRTVTSGIISALNRTIKIEDNKDESYMSDLIQTDATINPGNSGGPLIDTTGEVIGINSVKITSAEGIGFAVPINVIKPVIDSFMREGEFQEATLGIYAYDQSVAQYLTLKNTFTSGIYVAKITINGPAYNTELRKGDIINSIDDKRCNTINDLKTYIYTKKPGDSVTLKIARGRINKEITIKLAKK
ncbi:MAG: PDZ domain-containing protein [Clostridia bacterium]|nr:PDZ domain-containing protein [Clostridia bacterium]